ncbi:MAG: peptidoglycan recognition protein family protein [Actinomycetota bacterium]
MRTRILLLASLVAASLAIPASAPARIIQIPETMMSSTTFDHVRGRVSLSFRPTHVGFKWRGSEKARVLYRTIDEQGRTSRWAVAPPSHDMEEGSTRFSGLIEVDRPVRVEYRKRVPRGQWLGPVTLESINTLDGPTHAVTVRGAATRPGAPHIVTRSEWGADEHVKRTSGGCKRSFHPLRQLFVHHTAGSNRDYNGAPTMRAIYAYHVRSRGWCDIGYNFVIDWDGTIYEGRWARDYLPWEVHDSEDHRNRAVSGAHVANYNSGSVGISLMGNFQRVAPPRRMKRSLKRLLAWEVDRHGLNPEGTHRFNGRRLKVIAGHRNAGSTSCPGNKLYARLPRIRTRVKAMVGDGRKTTTLSLESSSSKIEFGDSAEFFGFLVDGRGAPLANRRITTHRKSGMGGWRRGPTATTGSDGGFSFSLSPTKNVKLAASFATTSNLWGSDSQVRRTGVRHGVTMAPSDRAPGGDGVYHYTSAESEAVVAGDVKPSHEGKTVTLKLFRKGVNGSSYRQIDKAPATLMTNGFSHTFVLARPKSGVRYKVTAKMPADRVHKVGYSGPSFLVID